MKHERFEFEWQDVYPKQCFWVHIAETCTRKRDFGYICEWQGLMDSNHR